MVLDQEYTIQEASDAVGVGLSAMRRWVKQLREERLGISPQHAKALTPEQQEIQALKVRLKQVELEKEILKKASALLMSVTYKNAK